MAVFYNFTFQFSIWIFLLNYFFSNMKNVLLVIFIIFVSFVIYSGCSETEIPLSPNQFTITIDPNPHPFDSLIILVSDSIPYY